MDKKDNIFKRILDAFASGEYDRDTVNRVHAWLADGRRPCATCGTARSL